MATHGQRAYCKYCDHEIEYVGRKVSPISGKTRGPWQDRGGNTRCPDDKHFHAEWKPGMPQPKRLMNPAKPPITRQWRTMHVRVNSAGQVQVAPTGVGTRTPARRNPSKLDKVNRAAIAHLLKKDFFELSGSEVARLLEEAKRVGYRKSPSAPGSTARMFHAALTRGKASNPRKRKTATKRRNSSTGYYPSSPIGPSKYRVDGGGVISGAPTMAVARRQAARILAREPHLRSVRITTRTGQLKATVTRSSK